MLVLVTLLVALSTVSTDSICGGTRPWIPGRDGYIILNSARERARDSSFKDRGWRPSPERIRDCLNGSQTIFSRTVPSRPIVCSDFALVANSSVANGPHTCDVLSDRQPDGWRFYWPRYSAMWQGTALTSELSGWDEELGVTALGWNDNDPYDLFVRVVTVDCDQHGRIRRQSVGRLMAKAEFDRRYGHYPEATQLPWPLPRPDASHQP